jgi:hypothetical protein
VADLLPTSRGIGPAASSKITAVDRIADKGTRLSFVAIGRTLVLGALSRQTRLTASVSELLKELVVVQEIVLGDDRQPLLSQNLHCRFDIVDVHGNPTATLSAIE